MKMNEIFTRVVKLTYPRGRKIARERSRSGCRHFYHGNFALDARSHNVNGITRQYVKTLEPVT